MGALREIAVLVGVSSLGIFPEYQLAMEITSAPYLTDCLLRGFP